MNPHEQHTHGSYHTFRATPQTTGQSQANGQTSGGQASQDHASATGMAWHSHNPQHYQHPGTQNMLSALTYIMGNLQDRVIDGLNRMELVQNTMSATLDSNSATLNANSAEMTVLRDQTKKEMAELGQRVEAYHRQNARAMGKVYDRILKLEARIGKEKKVPIGMGGPGVGASATASVSTAAAAATTGTAIAGPGIGVAGPSNGPGTQSGGTSSRAMSVSSGSSDRSESQTVLERLKELECIMLEVLEKANDPDAAKPVIVRHEMGTSPHVEPKEYADAAIEPLELDRNHSDVGVETDPRHLVDQGIDPCFADFIEKAIDPDLDMIDVDWEVPPYMHRGTSPPPQIDPPPPPPPQIDSPPPPPQIDSPPPPPPIDSPPPPPPDTSSAEATPQAPPAPELPPTHAAPEPGSLFDIEDVVNASQIAGSSAQPQVPEALEILDDDAISALLMEIAHCTLRQDSEPATEPANSANSRSTTPRPSHLQEARDPTPSSSTNDTRPSADFSRSTSEVSVAPSPPTSAPVSEVGDHDDAQKEIQKDHNNLMIGSMSPLTVISESSVSSISRLSLDSIASRAPSVTRAPSILAAVEASIARNTPPPNANEGDPGPSTRRTRKRRRSSGSGGGSTGGSATPNQNQSVARRKSLRVTRPNKKAKEDPEEPDLSCHWPEKIQLDAGCVPTQFIRCNGCDAYYHLECAAILPDDERVTDPDIPYLCPPCEVYRKVYGRVKRTMPLAGKGRCSRYDCEFGDPKTNGHYFISRVIGRQQYYTGESDDIEFLWLVKWADYAAVESTWEEEDTIPNPQTLIDEFEDEAKGQGLDPGNPHSLILLWEAVQAGFQ